MEYTLEDFARRQRFLEATESNGIDPHSKTLDQESLNKKREVWRVLYGGMHVEGTSDTLPVAECRAARVNAAFLAEYGRSQRFVAEFHVVRPLIAKTNELLDLEERARREAARMPLFATAVLDKVHEDVRDYFAQLTREQRTMVTTHFGKRVKQYLSKSGRIKVYQPK